MVSFLFFSSGSGDENKRHELPQARSTLYTFVPLLHPLLSFSTSVCLICPTLRSHDSVVLAGDSQPTYIPVPVYYLLYPLKIHTFL